MGPLTLRDVDNRDDAGAPYEFTGSVDAIVDYLDRALRADLTDGADGTTIDAAILALRAGDLDRANAELRPLLVSIALAE